MGAWLAKLHPILDSIMLLRLLTNFSQRTYKIHIVNAVNNPEDRGEEQHVLPKAAGPAMRRHMTPLISSAAMGTGKVMIERIERKAYDCYWYYILAKSLQGG